jgi:L-lactate dehydrogenase complex protein LldF
MTNPFRSHIRTSLADVNLQTALDANAERRIKVRQVAFESLDNPSELREKAHQVRADVVEHLDNYLEQFITRAGENGVVVHRAADADQAIKMVLEIAGQHEAKLIAKSKTMVSEEIGLNHTLEKHGLEVIETDLGEYIVQLRGEPPSHIITPAVHLRRQDVGRLFAEKLGIAYTEDISIMTNTARRILRQVFLDADIGISGVNFGVAETGTLCIVTNEGNGRMVTTVPPVHIALMGIERLVPTMADLSLMLSLLPRSATGQKLSVYTSLINTPRHSGDPDGPQARHLILVDNGRMAVRESEQQEILYCIRCGSCLNACPVFREIGGHAYVGQHGKSTPYPGPIGSVISPALFGWCEFGNLARASSLCGACKEACPVDIDLPKLLLRIRAGDKVNQQRNHAKPNAPAALSMGLKIFAIAGSSPRRFAFAQRLAGIFGSLVSKFSRDNTWMRLPAISGWGYSKDFPRPAGRTFLSRYSGRHHTDVGESSELLEEDKASTPGVPEGDISLPNPVNLVETYARELEALGGNFSICTADEISQNILEILKRKDINEILSWDAAYLPEGVLDRLSQAGIQITYPTAGNLQSSSNIRLGLTGSSAVIAETGSLLLLGGPGRPLTASLLPEIHITILREKDIYNTQSEVLQIEEIKHTPAAVLISGPSRTADIEMTLTIGVHGPGELHVICIQD